MKFKKYILLLFLIIAFILYKIYNKPHVNVINSVEDVSVSTKKIIEDFSSDEALANSIYLDKIIVVKGELSEIKSVSKKTVLILTSKDSFGTVQAELSNDAAQKIKNYTIGKSIVIKGICTGYLMDVILIKCELIE